MTERRTDRLFLCGYCGRGAVPSLPAKCPTCGAELTLEIKPKVEPVEIAAIQRRGQQGD